MSEGRWPFGAVVAVMLLVAAACGSSGGSGVGESETTAAETSATAEDETPAEETPSATAEDETPPEETPSATAEDETPPEETPVATAEDETPPEETPVAMGEDETPEVTPTTETAEADSAATVSFADHIQPIVADTCARCHTGDGPGTPHLRIDTAADVARAATGMATLIGTRTMPPWPASERSIPFLGELSLSDDEIATFEAWAEAGAPLDVDDSATMAPNDGVFRLEDPDLVVAPAEGYDGEEGEPDQYRCYVYELGLDEGGWITGYEFVPDQTEVVHHAIGYLIPDAARERAVAKAAEDPEPGWACFGSSGLGDDDLFLGWAPGQGPVSNPGGSGLWVGPGDFIVIQVHYHFEVDAPADRSAIWLELADADEDLDEVVVETHVAPAEIPCLPDEDGPLCSREASLLRAYGRYGVEGVQAPFINGLCGLDPADVELIGGIASSSCDLPIRTSGTLVSVLGHEHELGASFRMTLNPDTPDEMVLLDIPRWDFDWQYNYYPVDEIEVDPSDIVRLECSWDRLLRDPELEPAWVMWADGTDDEMCFGTLAIREG